MAEEKTEMMPLEKCPVCGHEVVEKEVENLLRGAVTEPSTKQFAFPGCHGQTRLARVRARNAPTKQVCGWPPGSPCGVEAHDYSATGVVMPRPGAQVS